MKPTEVVLVRRKRKFSEGLLEALFTAALNSFIGGAMLMLLLPLATEALHWRHVAPGYLTCCALVALARQVVGCTLGSVKPEASA